MKQTFHLSRIASLWFLLVLICAFSTAFSQDTIILKSGVKVVGKIKSMEQGIVKVEGKNGVESYEADVISSMMFCTPTKGKGNSVGKGGSSNGGSSSSQSGSPCDVKEENQPVGWVTFSCNMCGGDTFLQLSGGDGKNNKINHAFSRTLDKDDHSWKEDIKLTPGIYSWTYKDTNNNITSGKLEIKAGDMQKIVLFEK
ncbi:MAG: hypothetical protein IPP79_09480 [Chitinophagaceae bacterium]|nr:hypothetical protein [Chitinophagaceae bacterium]